jgi:hypothetical protein
MDPQLRQLVRTRASFRCEYCRLPQSFSDLRFHVEHIIPCQHGGTDELDNLALACPNCNLLKGPNLTGIDPLSREIVRLFNPRHDVWSEHFVLAGTDMITGTSPAGRTTVALFDMNMPERVRLRAIVRAFEAA